MNHPEKRKDKKIRFGSVQQKILLLIAAGISLGLTKRPDRYFRIIKSATREWKKINQKSLRRAIKNLYQSHMIDCQENKDGTVTLVLSENGRERSLKYNLENMKIKKPTRWDGMWRIITFDIPEHQKKGRDALNFRLKKLGLLPIQKSVFVCPYDCKDELDFVTEIFEVKPHVRYILAKEIDIDLDLKHKFKLP